MNITEKTTNDKTVIKINNKIICYYYTNKNDTYDFFVGKPSDSMVIGCDGLTREQLKVKIESTINSYCSLCNMLASVNH